MTKSAREILTSAVGCFGAAGFAISIGVFPSVLVQFLFVAGVVSAGLALVFDARKGRLQRGIIGVTLFCILGFGAGYLPIWYAFHLAESVAAVPSSSTR